MPPITWKNVSIPNVTVGQAAMGAVALKGVNNASNILSDLINKQTETDEKNWEQGKQNITDEIIAGVQTDNNYTNLLNAMQNQNQLHKQYGAQYDRAAVANAFKQQLGTVETDLIGKALAHTDDQNISSLNRRKNIAEYYKEQNVPEAKINDLVNKTFTQGKDKFGAIKQAAILQNTKKALADPAFTLQNGRQYIFDAQQQYGPDNINTAPLEEALKLKEESAYKEAWPVITSAVQQGGVTKGIEAARNIQGWTPEMQLKGIENVEKVFGLRASEKEKGLLEIAKRSLTDQIQFNKDTQPIRNKIAVQKAKLENWDNIYAPGGLADAQIQLYQKQPEFSLFSPSTWGNLFDGDIDPDTIEEQRTNMLNLGLTDDQANRVFARALNNAQVRFGSKRNTDLKSFIQKELEQYLSYRDGKNELINLEQQLANDTQNLNLGLKQRETAEHLGLINGQSIRATPVKSTSPAYMQEMYTDPARKIAAKNTANAYNKLQGSKRQNTKKAGADKSKKANIIEQVAKEKQKNTATYNPADYGTTPEERLKNYINPDNHSILEYTPDGVNNRTEISVNNKGEKILVDVSTGALLTKIPKGKSSKAFQTQWEKQHPKHFLPESVQKLFKKVSTVEY